MDYLTNDTDIKKVADAIHAKGGTSAPLVYPSGFVSAIQAIPSGSAKEEQEKPLPSPPTAQWRSPRTPGRL